MTIEEGLGMPPGGSNAMRTIAFASGKGGTGTTVLLINLAALLAERGKKVLVLDGNIGRGNLNVVIGHSPKYDLRHVLTGEKRLAEVLLTGPQGIHLIPGFIGFLEATDFDLLDTDLLLDQLEEIRMNYDFLLIDAGSGIDSGVLGLIQVAAETIIVTRPEPAALAEGYALIKAIVTQAPSYPFHLLYNMVRDARQGEQVRDALAGILRRFLGYEPGYAGFVVTDVSVGKSVVDQSLFVLDDPRCEAAKCLRALAEQLAPSETTLTAETRAPLWKRIIGWR